MTIIGELTHFIHNFFEKLIEKIQLKPKLFIKKNILSDRHFLKYKWTTKHFDFINNCLHTTYS